MCRVGAGARSLGGRAGKLWGAAVFLVAEFSGSQWSEVQEATQAPAVAAPLCQGLLARGLEGDSAQVRESEGA